MSQLGTLTAQQWQAAVDKMSDEYPTIQDTFKNRKAFVNQYVYDLFMEDIPQIYPDKAVDTETAMSFGEKLESSSSIASFQDTFEKFLSFLVATDEKIAMVYSNWYEPRKVKVSAGATILKATIAAGILYGVVNGVANYFKK